MPGKPTPWRWSAASGCTSVSTRVIAPSVQASGAPGSPSRPAAGLGRGTASWCSACESSWTGFALFCIDINACQGKSGERRAGGVGTGGCDLADARLCTLTGPELGVVEHGARGGEGRPHRLCRPGCRRSRSGLRGTQHDCAGRWITPGLIDCHTHLVYGGDRAHEFELRLAGASYEEVARAGGGIVSTVKATRAAERGRAGRRALPRLDALLAEGVTTVEIKSGYGLDLATELRQLRAARRLGLPERRPVVRRDDVPRRPCAAAGGAWRQGRVHHDAGAATMLPAVAETGLADAVDAFCEGIAFSPAQIARVLHRGPGARPAGEAACRPAFGPAAARHWPPASARCRPTISNTPTRPGPPPWPRPARWPCCCRAPSISSARRQAAAGRGVPPAWRAPGPGHRLQPRHLAADLAAADHEHGVRRCSASPSTNAWPA